MKQLYPWTPTTFKRKIKKHGLTRDQAADLVGAQRRTAQYWLSRAGPPYVVALVYELMERYNISPAEIEEIGTQLTKKRN